jgi:hypothetical protein
VHDVRGDDGVLGVLEDAVEAVRGRLAEGGVDLLHRGLPLQHRREVRDGAVRDGNAEGEPVELALEVGEDEADGLRGARRRRDDVDGAGAGPPEVLVRSVLEALVRGVGVDRCHEPALDAERVVEHLHHRGEAVRRAGGVRDDLLVTGEGVVVDAEHDGRVHVPLGRGGDDHLLRAAGEVLRGLVPRGEPAGGLYDHLGAEVAPREGGGVALGEHAETLAINDQVAVLDADLAREDPVHGVVLEQVRQGLGVGEVVDADDVVAVVEPALEDGAEDEPADPAEPVDADLDGHGGEGKGERDGSGRQRGRCNVTPHARRGGMKRRQIAAK